MATLKSLVDETTNIKDELKTCHATLKNSLIEKGVECSDNEKILDLINKIELVGGKWAFGQANDITVKSLNKYGEVYIGTNLTFDPKFVMCFVKSAELEGRCYMTNLSISSNQENVFFIGSTSSSITPNFNISGSNALTYLDRATSEGFYVNSGITNSYDPFYLKGITWFAVDF